MFDHLQQAPQDRPKVNLGALAVATAATAALLGMLVWGVLWVLSMLGLGNKPDPVEVSYEPLDDGRRFEELLPDGVVRPLRPLVPNDEAAETLPPPPSEGAGEPDLTP
jgi:hypothetical protein